MEAVDKIDNIAKFDLSTVDDSIFKSNSKRKRYTIALYELKNRIQEVITDTEMAEKVYEDATIILKKLILIGMKTNDALSIAIKLSLDKNNVGISFTNYNTKKMMTARRLTKITQPPIEKIIENQIEMLKRLHLLKNEDNLKNKILESLKDDRIAKIILGKSPVVVGATLIYMCLLHTDSYLTQEVISDLFKVSTVSIRSLKKKIVNTLREDVIELLYDS